MRALYSYPCTTAMLLCVALLPLGAAQPTEAGESGLLLPGEYHCVPEHPHHCDIGVSIELPNDIGWVNATVGLHNATNSSLPWEVHANGSIYVNVTYVGSINASASIDVTLEVANATNLVFVPPLNVTFPAALDATETHTYAYLLTGSSGPALPVLTVGVASLGAWETLNVPLFSAALALPVPTVTTPPTPTTAPTVAPTVTPTESATPPAETPLGPLALAALAAAAVLLARRRR